MATADHPENMHAQQQISAAEQKSRMDLQMSTALHGTEAFLYVSKCLIMTCYTVISMAHIFDEDSNSKMTVCVKINETIIWFQVTVGT